MEREGTRWPQAQGGTMRKNLFKALLYVCVLIAAFLGAIVSLAEFMLISDRKTNPGTANRTPGYPRVPD